MFDNKKTDANSYYKNAVKDAIINNTGSRGVNSKIFLMLNLSFLGIVSFFGYSYFLQNGGLTHHIQKTKVMGVSHISGQSTLSQEDIDYVSEIEELDDLSIDSDYSSQLTDYVNKEIKKLPFGITSKDRGRDIIVVVKKGDTLATLAKKYYNDATAYDKIIKNNDELTEKSHLIYPGQTLRISVEY